MAKATTQDFSIQEKLVNVLKLQKIDSKIDHLNVQKGELPMEVADLEDEVKGLETRSENINLEIEKIENYIQSRKDAKIEAENLIAKYEKQQDNVKNSREFEAITKEIELQHLEMRLCDKNIKDATIELEKKNDQKIITSRLLEGKIDVLNQKKEELVKIISETEKEEAILQEQSDKAKEYVDERLLSAYSRIRTNYKNGLAVVKIERDSCGGCFNMIPPQKQAEISQRKKIIVCEHCGRIMVDNDLFEQTIV